MFNVLKNKHSEYNQWQVLSVVFTKIIFYKKENILHTAQNKAVY